jgi:predicted amidohydrolase
VALRHLRFERGREWPVWDTGFAGSEVLICADGRQPEVARSLAVNGAELILDLTAWVSWARTTAELTTTQCEYLMPVRALENGVWVAAADKWGAEDQSIIYAGRSTVIGPDGVTRVCAPSDQETVVLFRIDPETAEAVPRRPALYGWLVEPTESLPVTKLLADPLVPDRENAACRGAERRLMRTVLRARDCGAGVRPCGVRREPRPEGGR